MNTWSQWSPACTADHWMLCACTMDFSMQPARTCEFILGNSSAPLERGALGGWHLQASHVLLLVNHPSRDQLQLELLACRMSAASCAST